MEGTNPKGGISFVKVDIIGKAIDLYLRAKDYVHFDDTDKSMCGDECCYWHNGACHLFIHDEITLGMRGSRPVRCQECVIIFGEE